VGQRVWVYGAQSYRPFGTAAELVVVPDDQAVRLPVGVSDEPGACLGIPGITAHRCVFGDGPVTGKVILVHGILGGVGSMAARLARWNGASVIGTVRRAEEVQDVDAAVCDSVVALDDPDAVAAIRAVAGGVHRVIEVSLSDNVDLDAAVVADGAVIAAYASRGDRPSVPFWPLLFANVSVRMLGSDDFPLQARKLAVQDLTSAAAIGALTVPVSARYPLTDVARSHDHVDAGAHGRVLLTIA
jgi:NADPH2:quinone reductase